MIFKGKIEKEGKYQDFKHYYSEIHQPNEEKAIGKATFERSMSENHKTKEVRTAWGINKYILFKHFP